MNQNPKIDFHSSADDDTLKFTLSNVNVSIANAIRRTILSDIPIFVFRTTPNDKNKAIIIKNTTRFTNEIIKQRLSCIPIIIKDLETFPYKNYIMELNLQNNTSDILNVTTEHFTVKDTVSNKILDQNATKEIFPPNSFTGDYILFLILKPQISNEIPGEMIHLTCEFDIATAKDDECFNVVSTCSYGFTIDIVKQENGLRKMQQTWKDDGKSKEQLEFETDNWKLLEGKRIDHCIPNSFDFIIETISAYSSLELVETSCDILIAKFNNFISIADKSELVITPSDNTMLNSFDIKLVNEDYTCGKVIEYFFHIKYFETQVLSFCGFKKEHPHIDDSIIRVAYKELPDISTIQEHFKDCLIDAILLFGKIKKQLTRK
jgi:DNA-directed RNA polymerase II subunit RPB3